MPMAVFIFCPKVRAVLGAGIIPLLRHNLMHIQSFFYFSSYLHLWPAILAEGAQLRSRSSLSAIEIYFLVSHISKSAPAVLLIDVYCTYIYAVSSANITSNILQHGESPEPHHLTFLLALGNALPPAPETRIEIEREVCDYFSSAPLLTSVSLL
jgi:hypothetical protein